jgi:hypothetical protein
MKDELKKKVTQLMRDIIKVCDKSCHGMSKSIALCISISALSNALVLAILNCEDEEKIKKEIFNAIDSELKKLRNELKKQGGYHGS